jgi:crotonobetainyl-CoA:carnitine CoA-transferase CaiB-like acyl-CoA transferase
LVRRTTIDVSDKRVALAPYRVLDLTDENGFLCGKILGDLGADVIKIEKPGGDWARCIGPFYKDIPNPEKSLYWFAFNRNKRGITLNIETIDGQNIFKKLAETAHFIIESFQPGFMDELGLGYETLSKINPSIIMTSITPYGQKGPYARYKASELTLWGMGGEMYITGDPDRPPVWVSSPQVTTGACAEAAAGSMIAHWWREKTGEGQHVDVSMQECVLNLCSIAPFYWELNGFIPSREGYNLPSGGNYIRRVGFPCKDGYICIFLVGGSQKGLVESSKALVAWMDEEGMAPQWLKEFDWVTGYEASKMTQELVDRVEGPIANFFMTKAKQELYEGAVERRIVLCPVSNARDLLDDAQLKARNFWVDKEHPELGDVITYPGAFAKLSETPVEMRRRAPLIGEHNLDIYKGELGMSQEQLTLLKQVGVI